MSIIIVDENWLVKSVPELTIKDSHVTLKFLTPPKRIFRHGWHSWTLTSWLDPSVPPLTNRSSEFRLRDEDPSYALSNKHTSSWVGAVELEPDRILLIGALDLGGRLEFEFSSVTAFFESGDGEWLITFGSEDQVFSSYARSLSLKFGKTRFATPPRVWCSWYSLYRWIDQAAIKNILSGLDGLPFDVIQVDDGWQVAYGDWEPNQNFSFGMKKLASDIQSTGRRAGLWIAPFMASKKSALYHRHPDWLLRDENGKHVQVGLTWEGRPYALDTSHPELLEWLTKMIQTVRSWGISYLKLDFLYAGALPGKRYMNIPREQAYRNALQVVRDAAGDAYILACGAPIIPSLGLVDGLRIGPDVTPYWVNKPLVEWLNNPSEASSVNAIRTCLHRLWLNPIVHTDPDVAFFRSRYNDLSRVENQMLLDLGTISGFKSTSDLPQWLDDGQFEDLRQYLLVKAVTRKVGRYQYSINGRLVDFEPHVHFKRGLAAPIWFARNLGLIKIILRQVLPAVWESRLHPK